MTGKLSFTTPMFSTDDGVLFSAYGVGRGYLSFALSYAAACKTLGARSQQRDDVMLAFMLNLPRITRAIDAKVRTADGKRVVLEPRDFD